MSSLKSPPSAANARHLLLTAPLLPQLIKLALPILIVLSVQTMVGVAETYFVSSLGTAALAGVALVFPVSMLMTMLSNGGFGGGVASAIARAIGAGRSEDANSLLTHSLVIAIAGGLVFSTIVIGGGTFIYGKLGAQGEVLRNALAFSDLVFLAAVPTWIVNLFAAALRGANNVRFPAILTASGALLTLVLSPLLIFGWGPIPRFGVAGAGWAVVIYYSAAVAVFIVYLRSSSSPLRLAWVPLEWRLFRQILGVGLQSSFGALTANLTVLMSAGLVGTFGSAAIAAYGIGSRLDYVLIPLLFSIGTASVTMVGANFGAGQIDRARRAAWLAALASAIATGVIGAAATIVPSLWTSVFTHDATVQQIAAQYLLRVAPFYVLFGVGMALYFASQGAAQMRWPIIASIARLVIVFVGGSWWVTHMHGSINGVFALLGTSYLAFGAINLVSFGSGLSWRVQRPVPSAAIA